MITKNTIVNHLSIIGAWLCTKIFVNQDKPIVLPYCAERVTGYFKDQIATHVFENPAEILRAQHSWKFCETAIPACIAAFPSISDHFPLPQLFGNFGTFLVFINVLLPAMYMFYCLGGIGALPRLIFTAMDYEGHRNGDKLRYLILTPEGGIREDAKERLGRAGGTCMGIINLVPITIQLGANFHIQAPLLKALYYCYFTGCTFGHLLLAADGEVTKFGAKARRDRMTRTIELEDLKGGVPALKEIARNFFDSEALKAARTEGGATVLSLAKKGDLVEFIVKKEEQIRKEGEEKKKKEKEEEKENEEWGDKGDEEEEGEEGGGVLLVPDPEVLQQTEEQQRLFAIILEFRDPANDEISVEDKTIAYVEYMDLYSKQSWIGEGDYEKNMARMYDRARRFVDKVAKGATEAEGGEKGGGVTKAENYDDTAAQQIDLARMNLTKGAETIAYTRLLWRATIHYLAWVSIRPVVILTMREHVLFTAFKDLPEEEFIHEACSAHEGVLTLFLFFDLYLDTAIGAFRKFADGDFAYLLNRFYFIAMWMEFANHPLLAGCMYSLIDTMRVLEMFQASIFIFVCEVSRIVFSDVITEFMNARFGGMVNSGALQSDEYLERLSVLTVYPSKLWKFVRSWGGKKDETSADNELQRRHKRAEKEKYQQSIKDVSEIILDQMHLILAGHPSMKDINAGKFVVNIPRTATEMKSGLWQGINNLTSILKRALGQAVGEKKEKVTRKIMRKNCKVIEEELVKDNGEYKKEAPDDEKKLSFPKWVALLGKLQNLRQVVENRKRRERTAAAKKLAEELRKQGTRTRSGRHTVPVTKVDM